MDNDDLLVCDCVTRAVAAAFGVPADTLRGPTRPHPVAMARSAAVHILRTRYVIPHADLSRYFGYTGNNANQASQHRVWAAEERLEGKDSFSRHFAKLYAKADAQAVAAIDAARAATEAQVVS